MASLDDPSDTHGRLIAASQVNGTSVYNLAGEKLGSIYDVMLSKGSGKAESAGSSASVSGITRCRGTCSPTARSMKAMSWTSTVRGSRARRPMPPTNPAAGAILIMAAASPIITAGRFPD